MGILFRIIAILFVAIAAFLIYAVVNAMGSSGGARTGVAIGYVAGAIVLAVAATWLWRRAGSRGAGAGPGAV
ncbi:MAG: hypothetical protein QOJ97_678 [Solirubrobacteraceae bacterium]|jgi:Na+/melibiose symporter-like transporter|nr:hypothetical protein [Solirubrobacteraceae bacterium]